VIDVLVFLVSPHDRFGFILDSIVICCLYALVRPNRITRSK